MEKSGLNSLFVYFHIPKGISMKYRQFILSICNRSETVHPNQISVYSDQSGITLYGYELVKTSRMLYGSCHFVPSDLSSELRKEIPTDLAQGQYEVGLIGSTEYGHDHTVLGSFSHKDAQEVYGILKEKFHSHEERKRTKEECQPRAPQKREEWGLLRDSIYAEEACIKYVEQFASELFGSENEIDPIHWHRKLRIFDHNNISAKFLEEAEEVMIFSASKFQIEGSARVFFNALGQCSSLRYLSLYMGNEPISASDMTPLIGRLPNLEYLRLGYLHMKTVPTFIQGLKKLKVLVISSNKFKELPLAFEQLEQLEHLFIDKKVIIPESLRLIFIDKGVNIQRTSWD